MQEKTDGGTSEKNEIKRNILYSQFKKDKASQQRVQEKLNLHGSTVQSKVKVSN